MGLPNGIHHLAICTKNIKAQIGFFTDVLGCELKALYWMHGVKGAWHGFIAAQRIELHRIRANTGDGGD